MYIFFGPDVLLVYTVDSALAFLLQSPAFKLFPLFIYTAQKNTTSVGQQSQITVISDNLDARCNVHKQKAVVLTSKLQGHIMPFRYESVSYFHSLQQRRSSSPMKGRPRMYHRPMECGSLKCSKYETLLPCSPHFY
jgi:hypothetical protein